MIINNFYKELKNNWTITIINIVGYSMALSACLIIGLFVYNQFMFDRFNEKLEHIYRVNYIQNEKMTDNATTNHQWYDVLPKEIPGIEKTARFGWTYERNIEFEKNNFKVKGAFGDKELFDIFSFPVLERENENFFEKPMSIALSNSLAKKVFGTGSPIGKILILDFKQRYTVTAVFNDIPSNSSLEFEFLTNIKDNINELDEQAKHHWLRWWVRSFVLVNENSLIKDFGKEMKPLQEKYVADWYAKASDYYLQPLKEIHLHSSSITGSFDFDMSIILIYIICSAGILILSVSCINYINLSIANFEARKKSVAIKKIIGAGRSYLFKQYMSYSVLLTFLCIVTAIIFSLYLIPILKMQGIHGIDIPFSKSVFWLILVCFGLITGILSGLYPSSYICKTVTTPNPKAQKSNTIFKNSLITIQFSITILLLVAVVTIKKQMNESIKGNLGFNHSSLISLSSTESIYYHCKAMHNEINKIPGVIAITSCSFEIPGYLGNYWPVKPQGAEKIDIYHTSVASNFFDVLSIPLKMKLGELREDTSNASNIAVINEEAVKQFGIGDTVVGRIYKLANTKISIAGIAGDFHIGSMHVLIKPIQFTISDENWYQIVKIEKVNQANVIAQIQKVWEKFETVEPFTYRFIDDLIGEQYIKEKSLLKLFNLFSALAMIISLIGLFGLVQLLLRFRIKEIGIRKVHGARVYQIISLLNKGFIKWVVIAFIVTCPIAWYVMHEWLQNFAYKTELSWWIFAFVGITVFVITSLTVSWQSWRAATRNPVESLRYE